jgi:hypothetical protein
MPKKKSKKAIVRKKGGNDIPCGNQSPWRPRDAAVNRHTFCQAICKSTGRQCNNPIKGPMATATLVLTMRSCCCICGIHQKLATTKLATVKENTAAAVWDTMVSFAMGTVDYKNTCAISNVDSVIPYDMANLSESATKLAENVIKSPKSFVPLTTRRG